MNARNLLYIRPFNPKKATSFADNKLKTKAFLTARGIPAAKLFARIESREQLRQFDFSALPDQCVLKPNYGFGGEGILLLKGRDSRGNFLRNGKRPIYKDELVEHIEDILDGRFSLGGRTDTAFFEQILRVHEGLAPFRPVGLPDLRIIVFNLVPVMAMLRIPTAASDGKANVHLGGIGIGINIAKGTTTHATQYNRIITQLPHGPAASGYHIPYWDEILLLSSKIQQITNIGYLAVDITLDQEIGPAVLEVNARAGLMVQVANLAPLRSRLERVQGIKVSSPEKGVRIGQDLFGNKISVTKTAAVTRNDKPIIGLEEMVTIVGDGSSSQQLAQVNPTVERSMIHADILPSVLPLLEKEPGKKKIYRTKLLIGGKKIQTMLQVTTKSMPHSLLIGRRDVADFFLDSTKKLSTTSAASVTSIVKSDLRAVDKRFAAIDKDLLLLRHLKPVNLNEEIERLQEDYEYNPVFQYKPLQFDVDDYRKRLHNESLDDSVVGMLLQKKRIEMLKKLDVLESVGVDSQQFTEYSCALFGKPTSSLIRSAEAKIFNRIACSLPVTADQLLTAQAVKERFEVVLDRYGLHDWQVTVRDSMVADVTVGNTSIYLRANATFEPIRVEALIAHEIETHVLTAENGSNQPYALLRRGLANYIETQEGLAVYSQNRIYGTHHNKYYIPAINILGLEKALKHSFATTRTYFREEFGYDDSKAISQAITIKRGIVNTEEAGGFTKGVVYFRGNRSIEKYIADGGDIVKLYVGKIALEDIDLVNNIPDLQAPLLLPDWLQS